MPGTATTIRIDGTPTNNANEWVDSLVAGGAWQDTDGGTVTIQWMAFQGTMDGQNSYAWTPAALAGLREALSLWESVANIDFVEVASAANADAKFWWGTEAQAGEAGVLGWSDLPGYSDSEVLDVLFNAQDSSMSGALGKGSLGLVAMVHEIGHLLGLAHPHDGGAADDATNFPGVNWWDPYEAGSGGLNQGIYTTMSYNYGWPLRLPDHTAESWGLQYGPMALDIAAIQAIYGANTTYASGDNVYVLPKANGLGAYWSSIWDTGGVDTISNAGASGNTTIDLRAATPDLFGGGNVSFSYNNSGYLIAGGFTIAQGVVIENAIGGDANDRLYGNEANNRLEGRDGDDQLDGGEGADTMIGGAGNDYYYVDDSGDVIVELDTSSEIDTVISYVDYTLGANVENLTLYPSYGPLHGKGNSSANIITGNEDSNILEGAGGADTLNGRDGNDRLVVSDLSFALADGGAGTDTFALGGAGLVLNLTDNLTRAKLVSIERIDLTGTGNNTLSINKTAVLGVVGAGGVLVVERDWGDVVQFTDLGWTSTGLITNADGTFERWVSGTAQVHVEQVTPQGMTIVGTADNDTLDGGAGNDILYGQGGDDTLIGRAAAAGGTNQLWGGTGNDTASYIGTSGAVYADLGAQAGYVGGVLVDQMNSIENLIGGSGNDVLVGDAGNNVLSGGAGSDLLYGQDGNDILIGGAAAAGSTNQLWGGAGTDAASYVGTTGAVYADIGSLSAYVDGVLTDQMSSIENLIGSAGNDVLVGDGGTNVLMGGAGADVLYGQGGDDILIGGAAAVGSTNQLWGGTGSDTASYVGTTGAVYADLSSLSAYVDGVLVDQMSSIENLIGGSGSNVLVGDAAGNVLMGGANTDYLYGQDGNDTLIGGGATAGSANQLWGGTGSDTASYVGTTGKVYADLGAQSGYVDGVLVDLMNSIENLTGSSNADTLVGNASANRLTGGAGGDALWGKGGADVFVYNDYADSNLVTGYDIIGDFVSGTSKLDLTALGLDASHIVIQSNAQSTSLYIEKTAGVFDVSTDLAISLVGANAITMGDLLL